MMIFWLSALGAIILLDKYAIGESGISQPIIAGTIIGALCGDIRTGIFIGALFQMIFLANLPIGRDVPPDAQAAGIAGAGSFFILKQINQVEPSFIIIILVGILASILGSALDISIRHINERLYYQFLRNQASLSFCHLSGTLTAFLRGIILFLPLFAIVGLLRFPLIKASVNKEILMLIVVGLCIANGIYLYGKKNSFIFFIIGVLCTLVFFAL